MIPSRAEDLLVGSSIERPIIWRVYERRNNIVEKEGTKTVARGNDWLGQRQRY
jgi:hypothetical protein